jgi:hypothetical protein
MENDAALVKPAGILRWRLALVGYFLALTFVLLAPNPLAWFRKPSPGPEIPWHWSVRWLKNDKLQHGLAYGAAGGLLRAAAVGPAAGLAACGVHGAIIEWLQPWFPPRACEWWDWCADMVGAGLGIWLYGLRRGRPRA